MADPISPFTPQMQAQLSQLLGIQTDRAQSTTPIHQAAMAMAAHMAPGYAQAAMTAPSSLGSAGGGITPTSSGSSIGPGLSTTVAASFVAALLKNGGNNALMDAVKKLAGVSGVTDPTFGGLIQGDKPLAGPNGPTGFPSAGPSGPVGGPSPSGGPNTVGTPFDISNQGGPNDVRAVGTDQIQQLIRLMGGNPAGSASPYDGLGNGGPGAI